MSIMVIITNEGRDNIQDWGWPGGGERNISDCNYN